MSATYEKRTTDSDAVWCAKWLNVKNMLHWHSETELVQCLEGRATVFIENRTVDLRAGETVFIGGGRVHRIESEEGAILITVLIDESLAKSFTSKCPICEKLTCAPPLQGYYRMVKREQRQKKEFYREVIAAETVKLLAEILRAEELCEWDSVVPDPKYARFKQILAEIQEDFADIDFKTACRRFSYSPSHFSRLISSLTGMSFTKYVMALRVEHAVSLLQNDRHISVTQVARECGFATVRNFNRGFKEMTGYAPGSLPKNYRFPIDIKYHSVPLDPTNSISVLLDQDEV